MARTKAAVSRAARRTNVRAASRAASTPPDSRTRIPIAVASPASGAAKAAVQRFFNRGASHGAPRRAWRTEKKPRRGGAKVPAETVNEASVYPAAAAVRKARTPVKITSLRVCFANDSSAFSLAFAGRRTRLSTVSSPSSLKTGAANR